MGLLDIFKKDKKEEPKKPVAKPAQPVAKPQAAAPKPFTQPVEQRPPLAQKPVQAQTQSPQQQLYIVKSGDSLSKIAQQFYMDPKQWNKIYEANRNEISNPDLIKPGQKLIIPL